MEDQFLLDAAVFVSHAATLAVLPLVPIVLATRLINGAQDARLPWTPRIELAALGLGALAGVYVFASNFSAAELTAEEIFRKGGIWDQGLRDFLLTRANPLAYELDWVLPWPFGSARKTLIELLVLLVGGAVVYAPIMRFRSARAVANAARNLAVILWGAYATVYAACYALWLLNKLNFWAFLLVLAIMHFGHKRTQRVVLKLD